MNILVVLVPCSLILGLGALLAFIWTIRSRQYEDMEGDAARVLLEDGSGPSGFDLDQGSLRIDTVEQDVGHEHRTNRLC
ncbi:MAG: cbb3-type cytochrome oxidase assembly protein CcoS [Pseudomonadota bacterium]